jgi:glycosyltransferase involved in cell wall biosynthesis
MKLERYIKFKKKNNLPTKNYELELPLIKKYIKQLRENYNGNQKYYDNINKPKISFITSVYNKEKYLNSFILSIQNQLLKESEIIIVDDCSTDNSVRIINQFQKNDKRIKLIKNEKNMGSLNARYNGAIHSKGEYLIFVDSDDIILKDGIAKAYTHIKNKNLDMVEFHSVFDEIKLIKRSVVMKSLNYIGKKYLNEKIIVENDVVLLFSFFKHSNSFQYIDELGYYYFRNNKDSITNTKYDPIKANQVIFSLFTNIKFLCENTNDNFLDKYFCIFKIKQAFERYEICLNSANQEFNLIKNILNNLLKSKFISKENKIDIKEIELKLKKLNNKN